VRPLRGHADAVILAVAIGLGVAAWTLPDRYADDAAIAALALIVGQRLARVLPEIERSMIFEYARSPWPRLPRWRGPTLRRLVLDGLGLTRNAEIHALLQKQAEAQQDLRTEVRRLADLVTELREALATSERQARRSSLMSFWGGVAVSIPIGALINLATG
jgi:hypothetical protein